MSPAIVLTSRLEGVSVAWVPGYLSCACPRRSPVPPRSLPGPLAHPAGAGHDLRHVWPGGALPMPLVGSHEGEGVQVSRNRGEQGGVGTSLSLLQVEGPAREVDAPELVWVFLRPGLPDTHWKMPGSQGPM